MSQPSFVSAAKVAANRLNASKSTGPRTPRGKAVAARNSLRHGFFARHLLLPGEDADELTQLKTALLRRLNPRDPMELVLVERVVAAAWKLQRLERFEALLFQRACDEWDENPLNDRESHGLGRRAPVPADVAWAGGGPAFQAQLDRVATQQRQLESTLRRNLRQLSLVQQQDIHEPVTEYAAERVAGEQAAQENRGNEATAVMRLTRKSQVAEVQEARLERLAARQTAEKRRAKKRRNEATAPCFRKTSLPLPVRGERVLGLNDSDPQSSQYPRVGLPTHAHLQATPAEPSPLPSPRVQEVGGSDWRNEATANPDETGPIDDEASRPSHSAAA